MGDRIVSPLQAGTNDGNKIGVGLVIDLKKEGLLVDGSNINAAAQALTSLAFLTPSEVTGNDALQSSVRDLVVKLAGTLDCDVVPRIGETS